MILYIIIYKCNIVLNTIVALPNPLNGSSLWVNRIISFISLIVYFSKTDFINSSPSFAVIGVTLS